MKKVIQKGDKAVYIEQNTGNIHIHGPGGIKIISPEDIESLREEMGQSFQLILKAIKHANNHKPIPHSLGENAVFPDTFIGREKDLKEIRNRLTEGDGFLLLVNGEGGIGKSTLAAKYYYTYKNDYKYCAWLVNEQGIGPTLLQLEMPLGLTFAPDATPKERLQQLAHALANLPEPCLLVLDNTNKPEDLQQYYTTLNSLPNFHILLTSRITAFGQAPTYKIDGLPEPDAILLFTTFYKRHKKEEDPLLKQVIKAVNHNTLIIELLAKNLADQNEFDEKYPLHALLEDIQQSLFNLRRSGTVETTYRAKSGEPLKNATVPEIVLAMYHMENLQEAEKQMASVFALLPLEAIPYKLLTALLPETPIDDGLKKLITRGWLDHGPEDKTLKINQVVQEVVRKKQHNRLKEDGKMLTDALNALLRDGQSFQKDLIEVSRILLRYAESASTALKAQPGVETLELLNTVGDFYSKSGDLNSAMRSFDEMRAVAQKLATTTPENPDFKNALAISCQFLGITHTALGQPGKALEFYQKDVELTKELYQEFPNQVQFKNGLAVSYQNLGYTHTAMGQPDKALEFYEKYNQLEQELYQEYPNIVEFKNNLAISYSKLGETQAALGQPDKALEFYEKYNQLEQELYQEYPNIVEFKNGLAVSYSKLGETHAALGKPDKALELYEKYNQLKKELHNDYPNQVKFKNGLAISCQFLGNTHTTLGKPDKALEYYQKYNQLEQELYQEYPNQVEFKNGLAISYEKLGQTHAALGQLDKALEFYQKYNQLEEELYQQYPNTVEFKNGLAISYAKLGETHAALGKPGKALEFYEKYNQLKKELHNDYPKQVEFKNGLAISCQFLGITHAALGKLDKALEFYQNYNQLEQELYQEYPNQVEFKNNLAISYSKLGETQAALGQPDKALEFYEKYNQLEQELYQEYPNTVEFKNGLAVSFAQLGEFYTEYQPDSAKARQYLEEAKALWEELVEQAPRVLEYQRNLDLVNEYLKKLL
jgi:tetratricopeptide (TPR) repeat protein